MISKKTQKAIKDAVKEAGYTHEAFAQKIGVGKTMISQWVSGARNPSLKSLQKIAKATGKPLNFFLENSQLGVGDNNTAGSYNNTETLEIMKKYILKLEEENQYLKSKLAKKEK